MAFNLVGRVILAYIKVLDISFCPNSSRTTLISTPLFNSIVANVCLATWNVTTFLIPHTFTHVLITDLYVDDWAYQIPFHYLSPHPLRVENEMLLQANQYN